MKFGLLIVLQTKVVSLALNPNLEDQISVIMFPGTGWPRYTPSHYIPFSSPSTIHRFIILYFSIMLQDFN
jgi:hypothetical protein